MLGNTISANGPNGRQRETTINTYIIHVYKIRPLCGIVEEHVILLDEALADRLVLRVHRHDTAGTRGIAETVCVPLARTLVSPTRSTITLYLRHTIM